MIDVIIPAYNAHDTIKRTLFSILTQSIKDRIKVYIVDDCSDKGYDDDIKSIKEKLDITIIRTKENSGPGVARQIGIENSNSEYIVFIDADDTFFCSFSVEQLYNFIDENNFNAVCSDFLEECENGILRHEYNDIWMHGKIYRRSFIEENNIKFNNTYQNEDTGFNHIISLIYDFKYLDKITYIWKYTKTSITRNNDYEYSFKGLEGYITNICYAIDEAEKRNVEEEKIAKLVIKNMYEIYCNHLKYIDHPLINNLFPWSKRLREVFMKYEDKISIYDKNCIVQEEMHKFIDDINVVDFLNDKKTFNDFLENINNS